MPVLRLSIITPSLNQGRYVAAAVDSVSLRDRTACEHIIIDGGSTDETLQVLAARPHLDVRVRPEFDSHQAINHGLDLAKGEIIGFLNTDDRYDPGALDAVVDFLATHPEVEAVCGGIRFFRDASDGEQEVSQFSHVPGPRMMLEMTFGAPGFNSWFIRAGLLKRLGGLRHEYRFSADRDLLLRVLAVTPPVVLPRVVYHYRMHEASRTLDPAKSNRVAIAREHVRMARQQSAEIWPHDRGAQAMLADWQALEGFKLLIDALRRPRPGKLQDLLHMPWYCLPAGLWKRHQWLQVATA